MNYYNSKNYFAFVAEFFLKKKFDFLVMPVNLFEFHSVIRGYHYFQKYWEPEANQELDSANEIDNLYEYFAIKTCKRERNDRRVN